MNLVRAIFVGLFDLLQPNIRAGVDFRWVIIALIGGEEVVERLRTGRLVVNRLFIGIFHADLPSFLVICDVCGNDLIRRCGDTFPKGEGKEDCAHPKPSPLGKVAERSEVG